MGGMIFICSGLIIPDIILGGTDATITGGGSLTILTELPGLAPPPSARLHAALGRFAPARDPGTLTSRHTPALAQSLGCASHPPAYASAAARDAHQH